MRKLFLGALLLLNLMGCAYKTINVNYMRPAEINLKGHTQIAIGGVYGAGPYDPAAATTKAKLQELIFNSGRFQLVDPSKMSQILGQLAITNSGLFDMSKAPELGKLLPATIFIYAQVLRYDANTRVDRNERKRDDGSVYYNYVRTSWAEVEISFQVIDCETGVLLAVKTLRDRYEQTTNADDNPNPPYIDYPPLLEYAHNNILNAFMKVIAPYQDTAAVRFAKNKKVPQVTQGIDKIKVGDWAGAIQSFEAAYAAYPSDPTVMYNLGLAYEYTFQFDRAEELFKKAYAAKPKGPYKSEIENCRQRKSEYEKLQAQGAQ
jgi:tetratricopeptide (TPR) repeat protein